jgi:hypothetical protein
MRYFKWLIIFGLVFIAVLFLRPQETTQDPPQEAGETLVSTGRINEGDQVTVGPYISKKGAGAKVTIRF